MGARVAGILLERLDSFSPGALRAFIDIARLRS
jgi:hypothetical protein